MIEISDTYKKLENYKFIDLFAGIGGFHLALSSFGAQCVFASEWDKHCQMVYKNNFGIVPYGDITKINSEDIPEHDILCAGFPCQAFSISGNQKGFLDTRGTLFFDVARIVSYHKPQILFLENVKNFARHDGGNTLCVVLKTLKNLGYQVHYQILNASDFGLPQKRERIYFVCFRDDLDVNFSFPKSASINVTLKDILLEESFVKKYIINRHDIKISNDVVEPDIFGFLPKKPLRIGTVNKGGQGERIYHELGHSATLSAYGGGVGAKTGLYKINGSIRKLAPIECARLQGFPEFFKVIESETQAYKQFGNSVPINVLQYILVEIIKALSEKESRQLSTVGFRYSQERI